MPLIFRSILLIFSVISFAGVQQDVTNDYSKIEAAAPTKQSLSLDELQAVFDRVANDPVARLSELSHYDPTGDIGFCFGRAMAAHLIARQMGLQSSSIRKLFIVGDLRSTPAPEWRFHVTTTLLGTDGIWHAIDPLMVSPIGPGTSLRVEKWISIVQSIWDKKGRAHLYWVDNNSILPDIRVVSDPANEDGNRLIELSFNPEGRAGFKLTSFADKKAYQLDADQQIKYFITFDEPVPADRFPFEGVDINGQHFDFDNYFPDMLTELLSGNPRPSAAMNFSPLGLYSPRVESWFR